MPQLQKARITICAAAIALCWAGTAYAQGEWRTDRAVYFTFSQPVVLPQATLPAGRYEFKLASSNTTRNVIQVYSGDGAKLYGMMMTIPIQRDTIPDKPEIRFMETKAGQPAPVASYFFPGTKTGWEFIYPRQQAVNLAKNTKEPVLTTADNVAENKMGDAKLTRVDANGQNVSVNETANAAPAATTTTEGEVVAAQANAQNNNSNTAIATTQSDNNASSTAPARRRLPETASAMPLAGIVGLGAIFAGLLLAGRRRVA
jgi:hypothetical protein